MIKKLLFINIFLASIVIFSSCIKDLPRDNPSDIHSSSYHGTGSVELYYTQPDYLYLYIGGSYVFYFNNYYLYKMDRDCGFDPGSSIIYSYSNLSGSYYYELKDNNDNIVKSGNFTIVKGMCRAIDLYETTAKRSVQNSDINKMCKLKSAIAVRHFETKY
ncbi:MAG: hypothetical protein HY738_11785 [Bacteroidia bacterium]|nr:hypothetical protein [Bacteroidia bacterium]